MALRRLAASSLRQAARQGSAVSAAEGGLCRALQTAGSSSGRDAQLGALLRALGSSQQGSGWQHSSWAAQHSGFHCWPSAQQAAQPAVADESESEPETKASASSKKVSHWEQNALACKDCCSVLASAALW